MTFILFLFRFWSKSRSSQFKSLRIILFFIWNIHSFSSLHEKLWLLKTFCCRKAPVEPKWDTHPSLLKKQSRVSRSNSSVGAYHSRDFRYHSLSPGPRSSTAPCTPGTPGISPIMSRASSVSNNVPDIAPQVIKISLSIESSLFWNECSEFLQNHFFFFKFVYKGINIEQSVNTFFFTACMEIYYL